jgi:hypothetical protein
MLRFATFALIASSLATVATADRLDGFRSLSDTEYGYTISTDIARLGRVSQRFEVRAGDCGEGPGWSDCDNDRERSEFVPNDMWPYGKDIWIGYSIFLPSDFESSGRVKTTVGQIHQSGGNRPTGEAGGLPSFPPMMQMEIRGNQYYMGVHILTGPADNVKDVTRDFNLIKVSEMRGKWTDIAIHFDTSKRNEFLEVFVNGEEKASITDWINFIPEKYYFKYGIYRSFVSRHGGPMPTQILYIDEVKIGSTREGVSPNANRPVD